MARAPTAVVTAAVALLAAIGLEPTARADLPPSEPGWTFAFADDFEGPAGSLPSSGDWRFAIGEGYPGGPPNWGTGEVTSYTDDPANVSLDGVGNLRITPLRDQEDDWTSARIETNRQDLRPPPGGVMRIEGRLQIPAVTGAAASGYWPAFWILGSPFRGDLWNWPSVGEVDIMENVNGVDPVWGVLHCGTPSGGPCDEPVGIEGTTACPDGACSGSFHRYAFEWDSSVAPNELRWYLDGEQYHGVSEDDLPADTWADISAHEGYFILLNVAIGGGFPDGVAGFETPTDSTEPGHPMLVDYVAVWYSGNNPPVIESVSAEPSEGAAPLEVEFGVEASDPDGDELSYSWEFGDGGTSDQQSPTYTYTEPGDYEATLTVSDGDLEVSDSVPVSVLDEITPPQTSVQLNGADPEPTYDGPVEVELSATDGDDEGASGVLYTEYRVNTDGGEGGWVESLNDDFDAPFVTEFTVSEPGSHEIEFRSFDRTEPANVEETQSVAFEIAGDGAPELRVTGAPRLRTVGPQQRQAVYRLRAKNTGDADTGRVRLCALGPPKRVKVMGPRCVVRNDIPAGKKRVRRVRVRIKSAARGKMSQIRLIGKGPSVEKQQARVRLRGRR